MKRLAVVTGLVVFLGAVLASGALLAAQAGKQLPDFTIDKIYLNKDCYVTVVVKNLGPGPVPDTVWTAHKPKSAGVYLYKNGNGWGGAPIWKFDAAKALQSPGGKATYTSTLKVTGSANIKAVVDMWNVVTEAKEDNNDHETKVACREQAQTAAAHGPCCIGGAYSGTFTDKASATCKKAKSGKFVFDIKQQAKCGEKIEGRFVNKANDNTYYLSGATVAPSGICCKIKGELKGVAGTPTGGEVKQIEAILCKGKDGKWYTEEGTYTNAAGCSGTFSMKHW